MGEGNKLNRKSAGCRPRVAAPHPSSIRARKKYRKYSQENFMSNIYGTKVNSFRKFSGKRTGTMNKPFASDFTGNVHEP
jgi:hypothetical protein